MRMFRPFCAVAFSLASLVVARAATAQPTAYLLMPQGCFPNCSTTLMTVAPDAPAVLSSLTLPTQDIHRPYVTPDGRFLAWLETGQPSFGRPTRVGLHDVVTGATVNIVMPDAADLIGSPARAEVFLLDQSGPFALSQAGVRRFGSTTCNGRLLKATSADGRRLSRSCTGNGTPLGPDSTILFDTGTGSVVATVPSYWPYVALNGDGTEAYAIEYVGSGQRLRRVQMSSGAVLADVALTSVSAVHFDPRTNRVFTVGDAVHVFDSTSLQLLASLALPSVIGAGASGRWSSLDGNGARLYLTTAAGVQGLTYISYLVFDTDTMAPVVDVFAQRDGQFVAAPRPLPAVGLAAVVQGTSVALQWAPQASNAVTTRYALEAGSAPGLSDIIVGLDLGLQTSFAASGVPPGRYHVRVRAANYTGLSAPSNEVVVQVP